MALGLLGKLQIDMSPKTSVLMGDLSPEVADMSQDDGTVATIADELLEYRHNDQLQYLPDHAACASQCPICDWNQVVSLMDHSGPHDTTLRNMAAVVEIPPRTGKAFKLTKGQKLTVIEPQGVQVSDLLAFIAHNTK